MLGKRSRPAAIGKITGAIRAGITTTDKPISPRTPKINYDHDGGGVGLGIVVALDKTVTCAGAGEVLAKYQVPNRSDPIPMMMKNYSKNLESRGLGLEKLGFCYDENYTYVTCRGLEKSVTRVYYDGGDFEGGRDGVGGGPSFVVSPAASSVAGVEFCGAEFLSSCFLCRKGLHGKDIFMYRGEKAFCSTECRERQITMDERKEQCRSVASMSVDVSSSSPYTSSRGQIFSAGIVAV